MLFPFYARAMLAESLNHLPDDEGLRIRLRLDDRLEGGRLTVKMQVDRLSGTMIGLVLGSVGGHRKPPEQDDAVAELEDLVRLMKQRVGPNAPRSALSDA